MLNAQQLIVLKAAIAAETDPAFVQLRQEGGTGLMAEWFNVAASPAFVVWRTSVTQDEIMQNGFDWVQVDNLSVGKARIWEWLFDNQSNTINPSKANVRAGIDEAWKGTAAMLAVREAVYSHCKRSATRAEKLFASGVGSTVSPGLLGWEGTVSDYDVVRAINEV